MKLFRWRKNRPIKYPGGHNLMKKMEKEAKKARKKGDGGQS